MKAIAASALIQIQHTVADYYGITFRELVGQRRTKRFAWPRQIAMTLARESTALSLPRIGRLFGGRHHTTVLCSMRAVERREAADQQAAHDLGRLRASIAGQAALARLDDPAFRARPAGDVIPRVWREPARIVLNAYGARRLD